jgi:hypothetical protein
MPIPRMKRREFVAALGGAAAWPLVARAQQPEKIPRISVLMPYAENDPENSPRVTALRQGLLLLGWTEGRVRLEYRWSADRCCLSQYFSSSLHRLSFVQSCLLFRPPSTEQSLQFDMTFG